jgi:hypothetical protein
MSSPLVKRGTLRHDTTEVEGVSLTMLAWKDQMGDFNRIYLRDDKVLRIEIDIDYNLTLGEVVDEYGPPEYVYVYADGSLEYFVFLDYPTQGFEVKSYTYAPDVKNYADHNKGIGLVSRDLEVTEVIYFAPTSLRELLEEVLLLPPDGVKYHIANSYEWTGFGQVNLAQP